MRTSKPTSTKPYTTMTTLIAALVAIAAPLAGCSAEGDEIIPDGGHAVRRDAGPRGDGGTRGDAVASTIDRSHAEVCGNGLDEDRNGLVDDGCACLGGQTQRCFAGDPALAGTGACMWGEQHCTDGSELGIWGACNGSGSAATETCDGIDNNCDGRIDEGCSCPVGETRPCYGGPPATSGVGACRAGSQACLAVGGEAGWGACTGSVLPAGEVCDGQDRNCNGTIDDNPKDLAGACDVAPPPPAGATSACKAGTKACVGGTIVCQGSVTASLGAQDGCAIDANCDGQLTGQPDLAGDPANCGKRNGAILT
ncbi:MAG: MopE-related protein [Deltaproteobacteria bacterium]